MSKYVNDIKSLIDTHSKKIVEIEELKEALESNKGDYSITYINDKEEDFKAKERVLQDIALAELETIKNRFNDDLRDWATPKGKDLADKDLKLMNGYITLTEEDLEQLGRKHKENNTMIRAIKEYSIKNNIYFNSGLDVEDIKEQFNQVIDIVDSALRDSESYSFKLLQQGDYLNKVSDVLGVIDN